MKLWKVAWLTAVCCNSAYDSAGECSVGHQSYDNLEMKGKREREEKRMGLYICTAGELKAVRMYTEQLSTQHNLSRANT